MAQIFDLSTTKRKEETVFGECLRHSQIGFAETDRRRTGRGRIGSISFDEADELFRSWIDENNWPYDAVLVDPRTFTFIFEKTSRLIASKPKGKLIPREGSDVLAARVNNALLSYQWDVANNGGTMLSKWAMMDMNTRKYGAAFALCKWRYETTPKGETIFDGPEMKVLVNRNFAHDLSATSIENANWVQVREYVTLQDLANVNDYSKGKPIYKNLETLKQAVDALGQNNTSFGSGGDHLTDWTSRNRQISRLDLDPVGQDIVFKTVEIVTEYRRDRWITFAPKHGVVIRDIPNPYENYEIPVTMLKYYAIDDDLYGLSEIEPIKGLQKAINAILSQYVDEINQNLYSPIAVGPGVRMHTLEWGKGARWQMNNPQTDFRVVEGKSNAAAYFNNTYSVLVSAMMNALGESSLGVSNIQPMQNDKTATEVKALQLQRNARDNFNQVFLSEAIKRQMMLWHAMNQKLLFSDPKRQQYIIRLTGKDALEYFQKAGMNEMHLPDQGAQDMFSQGATDPTAFMAPKFPINTGTAKEPKLVPKLSLEESGQSGKLYLEPKDLEGQFDFSVDVESMAVNADEQRSQGRQIAVQQITTNPNLMMILGQEGYKPKFKELFVSWLEDLGFIDADKFFEKVQSQPQTPPPGAGAPSSLGQPSTPPQPQTPFQGQTPPGGIGGQLDGIVNSKIQQQPMVSQNLGQPNASVLNGMMNRRPPAQQ